MTRKDIPRRPNPRQPMSPQAAKRLRETLEGGCDFWFLCSTAEIGEQQLVPFSSGRQQLLREVWDLKAEDIIAAYTKAHPCCRPWGWWRFVHQGPRRDARVVTQAAFLAGIGELTPAEMVQFRDGKACSCWRHGLVPADERADQDDPYMGMGPNADWRWPGTEPKER